MRMLQAFDTMDRDQRGYVTTKSLFAILQSLNELPGRKTVIFFSEGLPSSPALRAQLRSVVESANRSNITVYAIDTGGFLVRDTNDLRHAFERIDEDQRFHYLLTYSPKNQKFDGTFRNISVKVGRQNAQVFARKGYRALRFAPTL